MSLSLILTAILTIIAVVVILSSLTSNVYAVKANNAYFSVDIPDDWAYQDLINVATTPSEYAQLLVYDGVSSKEKMKNGGAYASFGQDYFFIKNAPFNMYVKYKIDEIVDKQTEKINITSKQNTTIDNETAVKMYAAGINSLYGIKFVEYWVMHNKQPYHITYIANVKDYDKYLPVFEQMVKTFKFAK